MRISDWSSDVCSSDLAEAVERIQDPALQRGERDEQQIWKGDLGEQDGERQLLRLLGEAGGDHVDEPRHAGLGGGGEQEQEGQEDGQRLLGEALGRRQRSEEHTSELQSLMRISYAVFCLTQTKHRIPTPNKHRK